MEPSDILSQAGWFADRRVNLDHVLHIYRRDGYDANDRQLAFIASLDGIQLHAPGPKALVEFNASSAAQDTWPQWTNYASAIAGTRLVPVGVIRSLDQVVFLGEDLSIYCGFEEWVSRVGDLKDLLTVPLEKWQAVPKKVGVSPEDFEAEPGFRDSGPS